MNGPTSSPRARRFARAGLMLGGALAALVATGGFLHTSVGRPLLRALGGGGCPFGHAKLEPARREALRRQGLAKLVQANRLSPARPAFGFDIGREQRADVEAWSARHGLACKSESKGAGLACDAVPGELVGRAGAPPAALYFRFDAGSRLVGVLGMLRTGDVERAVSLGEAERAALHGELGAPTRESGELSIASIGGGSLRQARTEYRYRDYSALASVTNLGAEGYLVTEEAQLTD